MPFTLKKLLNPVKIHGEYTEKQFRQDMRKLIQDLNQRNEELVTKINEMQDQIDSL